MHRQQSRQATPSSQDPTMTPQTRQAWGKSVAAMASRAIATGRERTLHTLRFILAHLCVSIGGGRDGWLFGEADLLEQLLEAGLPAQGVITRIGVDVDQSFGAFLIGLIEEIERAFPISQAEIDQRHEI